MLKKNFVFGRKVYELSAGRKFTRITFKGISVFNYLFGYAEIEYEDPHDAGQ